MTKMKKFFIPVLAIMGLFVISSCEDMIKEYTGPWFIHFDKANVEISESSTDTLDFVVFLSASTQSSATTVEFTVSSTSAEEGTDYEVISPSGTTLTFEPGVHEQTIQVRVFGNLDATGDKDVVIDLASNSAGLVLGMPGEGSPRKSCTITIKDDDCPLLMENWVGTVLGNEKSPWWDQTDNYTFEAGSINEPNRISLVVTGLFQPQLQTAPDDAWGETWLTGGKVTIILDNTDPANPKAIIQPQYFGHTIDPASEEYDYWIFQKSGPGTFSTCSKTLSLPYSISWDDDYSPTSWANFTVTFEF